MRKVLEAAVSYAGKGLVVFAARPDGKLSYKSAKYSDGRNWGATSDLAEVRYDFTRWPRARVGLPTGIINKIVIIETDTPEGHNVDGLASLRELEAKHCALPETLTAVSPSGSVHRYFRHPGDGIKIKSSASAIGVGIDVRGDGGMVIAPPSVNPDGRSYRWLNRAPIALMPAWLIELTRERPKPRSQTTQMYVGGGDSWLRGLIRLVANAPEGQRNSILFWSACRGGEAIRDGKANEGFVTSVLLEAALRAGLDQHGAQKTIASGLNR
jgi:hypothetical protein